MVKGTAAVEAKQLKSLRTGDAFARFFLYFLQSGLRAQKFAILKVRKIGAISQEVEAKPLKRLRLWEAFARFLSVPESGLRASMSAILEVKNGCGSTSGGS